MGGLGLRELAVLALVLLVLVVVWRIGSSAQQASSSPALEPLDTSSIATIDGHVARGERARAIEVYRQETGASPIQCARAIDSWRPGGMAPTVDG